jgi:heptosyltransferase-1
MPTPSSPPQRVLLVRLSAIGDVVMASCLVPALRRKFPAARIEWLVEDGCAELLEGGPPLDAVHVVPRRRWRREGRRFAAARGALALARTLRGRRFDWVIDAQGLWRSAAWAWLSGARFRAGLHPREAPGGLYHVRAGGRRGGGGAFCGEYRALGAALGLDMDPPAFGLRPTDAARARAAELLAPAGPRAPVFLLPFTTRPQKHWFDDLWAALLARLAPLGHPLCVLGGPGDEPAARAIAAAGGVPGVQVVAGPQSNLQDKMALLERAALAVGVDTGLTHLAFALGRPAVALFGSTCPYREVTPRPGAVLYERLACSPCHRRPTCDGRFDCMKALTVERVAAAAESLLRGNG